jgi:hypothetical protein
MLPNTAPSTPITITALPPIVANPSFHVVAVTLTTPFGSGSSATMRRGVAFDGSGASWLPRSPWQDT